MNLIEISPKQLDLPFVSRLLRAHKLTCAPLQGFYKDAQAWAEDADWKRTVERYDWGVIMFCSNHKTAQHYTAVIQGSFDIDKGEAISDDGKRHPLPIAWYKEMSKALKGKGTPHVDIKIPECLGYHEDDAGTDNPICDGGYVASRGAAEKPCAWRDRCIPFQAYCVNLGQVPVDVRKPLGPEQIVQLTTKLRDEADSKAVPVPVAVAAQPNTGATAGGGLSKPALKVAPRSTGAQKPPPPAGGTALFWEVFNSLKAKVKGHKFLSGREEAQPGDIFIQDRSSSGYISLYCEPVSGRRIAIVEIRLKSDRVHALFPFEHDHKLLGGLNATPAKDGKFISMLVDIPRTVTVDRLAAILSAAINTGVIQLPNQDKKVAANA